jgi:hypothetical protein
MYLLIGVIFLLYFSVYIGSKLEESEKRKYIKIKKPIEKSLFKKEGLVLFNLENRQISKITWDQYFSQDYYVNGR